MGVGAKGATSFFFVHFVQLSGGGQDVVDQLGEVNAESDVVSHYLSVGCPVNTQECCVRPSVTVLDA